MEIKVDNEVIEKLKEKIKKEFKTLIVTESLLENASNEDSEEQ